LNHHLGKGQATSEPVCQVRVATHQGLTVRLLTSLELSQELRGKFLNFIRGSRQVLIRSVRRHKLPPEDCSRSSTEFGICLRSGISELPSYAAIDPD
jgi:hypothetical protein